MHRLSLEAARRGEAGMKPGLHTEGKKAASRVDTLGIHIMCLLVTLLALV